MGQGAIKCPIHPSVMRSGDLLKGGVSSLFGNSFQDQHVLAVLLQAQRVGFDVPQDSIEMLLVHAKQVTIVLLQHYCRRSGLVCRDSLVD